MIGLYRTLYAPFPLAVLMSGLTLGLASNLMTDVFRNHPLDWTRLVASGLYFLSALAFSILHADFAKIDTDSRALISSGGGIPDGDGLVTDMLHTGRTKLILALCLGAIAFAAGIGVSSGLFSISAFSKETKTAPAIPVQPLEPAKPLLRTKIHTRPEKERPAGRESQPKKLSPP